MVEKIEDLKQPHSRNSKRAPIAVTHPHLVSEWLFEKNCGFSPDDFTASSNIKAWWRCCQNTEHVWQTKINYRTEGHGCPFCAGKTVRTADSLSTAYPDIAAEWHPTRNEGVTPEQVRPKSGKRFWWLCRSCGYEWQARVDHRTRTSGCFNCKLKFFDLTKPEYSYCLEYFDKEKNEVIGVVPSSLTSRTKIHWRCPKDADHVWQDKVRAQKTRLGFCPFCADLKRSAKQQASIRKLTEKLAQKTGSSLRLGAHLDKVYAEVLYKVDVVNIIAKEVGTTKRDTERVIDAMIKTIITEVAQNRRVALTGFGTFQARNCYAWSGVGEKTGEPVPISRRRGVFFKVGKDFADAVCSDEI